ncbi:hypothetical protein [Wolbachia sp. wLmal]|uniref:hypothetical protein n=1 Tax=Wolbachia sp. wLmal TaxID=3342489 RepID=UPI003C2C7416
MVVNGVIRVTDTGSFMTVVALLLLSFQCSLLVIPVLDTGMALLHRSSDSR